MVKVACWLSTPHTVIWNFVPICVFIYFKWFWQDNQTNIKQPQFMCDWRFLVLNWKTKTPKSNNHHLFGIQILYSVSCKFKSSLNLIRILLFLNTDGSFIIIIYYFVERIRFFLCFSLKASTCVWAYHNVSI